MTGGTVPSLAPGGLPGQGPTLWSARGRQWRNAFQAKGAEYAGSPKSLLGAGVWVGGLPSQGGDSAPGKWSREGCDGPRLRSKFAAVPMAPPGGTSLGTPLPPTGCIITT